MQLPQSLYDRPVACTPLQSSKKAFQIQNPDFVVHLTIYILHQTYISHPYFQVCVSLRASHQVPIVLHVGQPLLFLRQDSCFFSSSVYFFRLSTQGFMTGSHNFRSLSSFTVFQWYGHTSPGNTLSATASPIMTPHVSAHLTHYNGSWSVWKFIDHCTSAKQQLRSLLRKMLSTDTLLDLPSGQRG